MVLCGNRQTVVEFQALLQLGVVYLLGLELYSGLNEAVVRVTQSKRIALWKGHSSTKAFFAIIRARPCQKPGLG